MSLSDVRGVTAPTGSTSGAVTLGERVGVYVALTKPRIIELLLVTTVPPMVLAAGGWPGSGLVLATVVGGALVAGCANALNMVYDRDIDAVMARTRSRPLPSGAVTPTAATVFAILLGLVGATLLWTVSGALAARLAVAAAVYYVGLYTALLKRRTAANITIGGVAGAAPVLVGWAAVTGGLAPAAWVLFAVVVLWTPPHFWALAIVCERDYAEVGVPMLPVARGAEVAARRATGYAVATAVSSLVLALVHDGAGWLYLLIAAGLGIELIRRSVRMVHDPRPRVARRLFTFSIVYLTGLFAAVLVTPFTGLGA